MNKNWTKGIGLLAFSCLAGCGNQGFGSVTTQAYSSTQSTPVGSIEVLISNPSLPADTASLAYTITDTPTGQVVVQQTFSYPGGSPAAQTFTNVPSEVQGVTVQAFDSNNNLLLQASNNVSVTDGALSTDTLTLTANPAVGLAFVNAPANVVAGSSLPTLVVKETDANGNLVASANDTISLSLSANGSGAVASGPLVATAVNGQAQFPGISVNQVGSGFSFVASGNNAALTTANSSSFSVLAAAGTPSQLVFTVQPPPAVGLNVTLSPAPQVAVEDANGTIVNSATDPVTLSLATDAGGASLIGSSSLSPSQGLATFNAISLSAPGTGYAFLASSGNVASATSAAFAVTTP